MIRGTLFAGLSLISTLIFSAQASFADGHDQYHAPDTSYDERQAARNAENNAMRDLDRIIRRETANRGYGNGRSHGRETNRWANCGTSYWGKREALRACPPATTMKTYSPAGEVFYYCDCD